MALDAIDFIDALDVGEVDLLGFSIGSFVAQEIALVRPAAVRRVVLASSAPRGASGMHGWAPEVSAAVGKPEAPAADYLTGGSRTTRCSSASRRSTSPCSWPTATATP